MRASSKVLICSNSQLFSVISCYLSNFFNDFHLECEVKDPTSKEATTRIEETAGKRGNRHGKRGKNGRSISDTPGTSGNTNRPIPDTPGSSGSKIRTSGAKAVESREFGKNLVRWEPPGRVTKGMDKEEGKENGAWEGRLRPYQRGQAFRRWEMKEDPKKKAELRKR